MSLHFRVSQQIIVDLFGAAELHVGLTTRGEHPRMRAIPGIVVDDVLDSAHPPVYSEQIEGRRADEEDWLFVGPEERADFRDAIKSSGSECAGYHRNPEALPVVWRCAVRNSLTLQAALTWKQR